MWARILALAGLAASVAAQDAPASGAFAWVPLPECASPVQLCYDGPRETLEKMQKVDFVNPCRVKSQIVAGCCSKFGFMRRMGMDPVFRDVEVYARAKKKNVADAMERVGALDKALGVLHGHRHESGDGVCWKHGTTRGLGRIGANCTAGEERQMGICYKKCPAGQEGLGPVCWHGCKSPYATSVGAFCCKSEEDCTALIKDVAVKMAYDIGKIIMDHDNQDALLNDFKKIVEDAHELELPDCTKLGSGAQQHLRIA